MGLNPFTCILFDLDGTLINSKKDIAHSTNYTLKKLGYPEIEPHVLYDFVGRGVKQLLTQSLEDAGAKKVSEKLIQEGRKIFKCHYQKQCLQHTHWYPGVVSTLKKLNQKFPLAILTNKPKEFTKIILDGLNGSKYFFDSVSAGEAYLPKPDPAGAHYLIKKAGVKASETLLVGDCIIDVQTARKAKIKIALVTYGFGSEESLKGVKVDYTLKRFSELLDILS
jgi:phosphoglycolate phosphatase